MGTRKKLAFSATALKQEKPEMDDFERKKNSGSKGEIFWKMSKFLMDTLSRAF